MAILVRAIDGMSNHTAADLRGDMADILANEGVADLEGGHLAVTEASPADMSVDVAPGVAYVENDAWLITSDNVQRYWDVKVTATENLAISSNPSGSTRIDLVVLQVDDTATPDANASNVATLEIVEGTAGAGTPALPDDALLLATITVANGETEINTADIQDDREQIKITEASTPVVISEDGWTTLDAGINVTRESTDNPTVVLRFDANVRDYIWKGMRIKATENSIVHYFIVSADPTDDSGDTLVTCLSEIDTTTPTQAKNLIGSGTISDVAYAPPKTYPKGFPVAKRSWTFSSSSSSDTDQANPTTNTWYNYHSAAVPIGDWETDYRVFLLARAASGTNVRHKATLSTANNSESDPRFTTVYQNDNFPGDANTPTSGCGQSHIQKALISLASKTTLYVNAMKFTVGAYGQLRVLGSIQPTVIRATSTLL